MAYDVYLDKMLLPVTPAKLTVKAKNQNKTITLLNEGEINFLKLPGLLEIEFDALLPQANYPFNNRGARAAGYYISRLEKLKKKKKHFQFIVSRTTPTGRLLFDTNLKVSLEDYRFEEDAKALGMDVKATIKLKQWRDFGTKIVKIQQSQNGPKLNVKKAREASTAPEIKTYEVKSGDCLWNIAKKYLGSGARYTEIAELNADKIINPNLIYPGQVLTLPSKE